MVLLFLVLRYGGYRTLRGGHVCVVVALGIMRFAFRLAYVFSSSCSCTSTRLPQTIFGRFSVLLTSSRTGPTWRNTCRSAVSLDQFWGQITHNLSVLFPKQDCSPKRVNYSGVDGNTCITRIPWKYDLLCSTGIFSLFSSRTCI